MQSVKRWIVPMLTVPILLLGGSPADARFFFQCPGYVAPAPGANPDLNGDGMLRFSDGELTGPFTLPNGLTEGTLAASGEDLVCMHLSSGDGFIMMADGAPMYIFGFSNVTGTPDADVGNRWNNPIRPGGALNQNFPAPLVQLRKGDHVYLSLSNVGMLMRPDLFDAHSVHFHGFPQASAVFDGLPESAVTINMGSTLTYYYQIVEEGTFMYHCHVEASEHMQMGMLGNLFVTPPWAAGLPPDFIFDGDPVGTAFTPSRREYLQITAFDPQFHEASISVQPLPFAEMRDTYPMLNGRGYPDTVNPGDIVFSHPDFPEMEGHIGQKDDALIVATAGDQIALHLSSLSTVEFDTIISPAIPMRVVGRGARKLGPPAPDANVGALYYTTHSLTLGGGESFDVILDTTGIPAGTYFLYTSNLHHLNNNLEDFGGMMTEIVLQ